MNNNTTLRIGSIALIEKLNAEYGFFNRIFSGVEGKAKDFIGIVQSLVCNRLDDCVSVSRMNELYPDNFFLLNGCKSIPSERSIFRTITRVGKKHEFILNRYQSFVKNEGLATNVQDIDFSSSYFEGRGDTLGAFGYSRDGQPGKKQLTFGISTGINGIPSALTIQKGNVSDKKHFDFMLKTAAAVLEEHSLLIFDCGGNTKENKRNVRERTFHYLTLKPKQRATYSATISRAKNLPKNSININETIYECTKIVGEEITYLFFSHELKERQSKNKKKRFERELERNRILLQKTKDGTPLATYPTTEGTVIAKGSLQTTLTTVENAHITGLEGYFILESSLDMEPERALSLYKDKDKAEKFFRNVKEGTDLRPMRHWTKDAIIGHIIIVFLTNALISLTQLRTKELDVKNTKLLKKYLNNLTLATLYPPNGGKTSGIANISPQIEAILGEFLQKYEEKALKIG
jgi:transposase